MLTILPEKGATYNLGALTYFISRNLSIVITRLFAGMYKNPCYKSRGFAQGYQQYKWGNLWLILALITLVCVLVGGLAEFDLAGLQALRHLAQKRDGEHPVLKCRILDLDMVGQLEALFEAAAGNTAMQIYR